jgi:molybdopterin synthase catalytic subunit
VIQFCGDAIAPEIGPFSEAGKIGAEVVFHGVVRQEENGREIRALRYEVYPEMAERTIRKILESLAAEHPCHRALVIHRHGLIPVGEAAIFVRIDAAHRAEAFAMLAEFMNRLKKDVPIWKAEAIPA